MNLFDWLLIAHLIGDFLLQTETMASRKTQQWSWMLAHVGVYTGTVAIVLIAFAVSHRIPAWIALLSVVFVGASHALLDRRTFTKGWMRWNGTSPDHAWLPVVVDQTFHLVTLAIVAQVLSVAVR